MKANPPPKPYVGGHPPVPPPPPPLATKKVAKAPEEEKPKLDAIEQMVRLAHKQKASDIHIRVGQSPRFRVRGKLETVKSLPVVTPEIYEAYLEEILNPKQRHELAETNELDTAIFYPGFLRCRINCFETLAGGAMVLRLISLDVPSIDQFNLPQVLKKIVMKPQGLVLVTGPTGSGKSTTLAAMIRHLNENAAKHVITIEDPIEFVHSSQQCLISQREVGLHTHDFHASLRSALREDPDAILIGEMRDRLTVNIALQASQTGHLVLGTLHTRSALNSLERLLNLFNPEEHVTMRVQIAESLVAVVAQLLVPTVDEKRVAIHDILINTLAMQDYLVKGDMDGALHLMRTDKIEGMQIMNQALYRQVMESRVAFEEAAKMSPDPDELDRLMRTGGYDSSDSPREWA